jgi:hypothetical protein
VKKYFAHRTGSVGRPGKEDRNKWVIGRRVSAFMPKFLVPGARLTCKFASYFHRLYPAEFLAASYFLVCPPWAEQRSSSSIRMEKRREWVAIKKKMTPVIVKNQAIGQNKKC